MLIKPKVLQPGDKVATVSLSWGGAGEPSIRWRYDLGVKRLQEVFGLEVTAMPNSLKGSDFVYENPKARAEDLMAAFRDSSIKAIISNIGGSESIRLLPYIDFNVIRDNPKIFMGYSDATITHLFCLKAGLSSFYGPAILTEFAENGEMHDHTVNSIKRTLMSSEPIGEIFPSPEWTSERVPWENGYTEEKRKMHPDRGYELLSGSGKVQGRLIGGCIEVLEFAKGTEIWPKQELWDGAILFFETSEDHPYPDYIVYWLRNYAAQGILQRAAGMIFAKPKDEKYYEEYKDAILTVLREYNLEQLPILYNLGFGHTDPMFVVPYGALAEIDCERKAFAILEGGVEA